MRSFGFTCFQDLFEVGGIEAGYRPDDRRLRSIQEAVVVNRAKTLKEAKPLPIDSIGPLEEFVRRHQLDQPSYRDHREATAVVN